MTEASVKQCASCGLAVGALIEMAHLPDRRTAPDRVLPLCLLCHRALDLHLTSFAEIEVVEANWKAGGPAPHRLDDLIALWTSREPNWAALKKDGAARAGRTIRRRFAAKRAAATKARLRAAAEPVPE
ncbi:hypothetical protein [Zavarzinia aquatilis]|uniref:Uncharacterized protein n=1 Tax=Zavarzinia aquatilis TaxID=2211142 RepID=A0A317EBN9_9PROT|nr:hypothetical protein [Zavarzinia aquatilis]PWR24359.1 hypothetical protein DKG74_09635 [Zavarzinia aquatilis]